MAIEKTTKDDDIIDVLSLDQEDQNKWLTIDDAVGILGIGDRQIRRYITDFNWPIRHMKDNSKIKTFIWKETISNFLKNNSAKVEETSRPTQVMVNESVPDDRALFTAMRKLNGELAMTLPDLIQKYQENTEKTEALQETITKITTKKAIWMTIAVCVGLSALLAGSLLYTQLNQREDLLAQTTASLENLRDERNRLISDVHTSEKELLLNQAKIHQLQNELVTLKEKGENPEKIDSLLTGFQTLQGVIK